MRAASQFSLVFVTAPNAVTARRLARAALKARLVACANLVPAVESHYWWKGKIAKSREVLVLFKTSRKRLRQLERLILEQHPYDTPEFVSVPLGQGTPRYVEWILDSIAPSLRPTAH